MAPHSAGRPDAGAADAPIPLPCIAFQRELARLRESAGHRVVEDMPLGAGHADLVDLTAGEWLEIDRVDLGPDPVPALGARLDLICAPFARPEAQALPYRRICIIDLTGTRKPSDGEIGRAVRDWFGGTPPPASPDEIRIKKGRRTLRFASGRPSSAPD